MEDEAAAVAVAAVVDDVDDDDDCDSPIDAVSVARACEHARSELVSCTGAHTTEPETAEEAHSIVVVVSTAAHHSTNSASNDKLISITFN